MDVVADLEAPCTPEVLFDVVGDLGRYPEWLSIVPRAVPEAADTSGDRTREQAGEDTGDGEAAWSVDLRGRLGPLARSKRLRMVRTELVAPHLVRFERRERDGRSHSDWVLHAEVHPTSTGSRLEMRLHYGGSFGGSLLERMLRDEIQRSGPRLLELVSGD